MTEITPADFGEWDWENVHEGFYPVMREIEDINFHRIGDGWTPWAERGDVPALLAECRGILDQLEKPLKEARRALARIEGAARLRAHGRERNGLDPADDSEQEYLAEVERRNAAEVAEVLDLPSGRYPELRLGGEL